MSIFRNLIRITTDNIINNNMNTIKFTSKTTCRVNGVDYKGYTVGDLPNSFGFKEIYLGQDEEGNHQFKFGKSQWFNYKGLTFVEAPQKW